MFRHLMLGAAACLAVATGAAAGPRSLERAFETTTAAVSLPETLPSSINARGCLSCKSMRLDIPATAQLFVGTEAVTMKELRGFVLGKNYDMVIFYELDQPVVRRIVVSGVLPPKTQRTAN